jgi:hypothetical protein
VQWLRHRHLLRGLDLHVVHVCVWKLLPGGDGGDGRGDGGDLHGGQLLHWHDGGTP